MSRGRTAAAALTTLGLVLGASPGVARAAEWTSARTTAVNYQPTQTTVRGGARRAQPNAKRVAILW